MVQTYWFQVNNKFFVKIFLNCFYPLSHKIQFASVLAPSFRSWIYAAAPKSFSLVSLSLITALNIFWALVMNAICTNNTISIFDTFFISNDFAKYTFKKGFYLADSISCNTE